jgi:hypothetical protein
MGLLIAVWSASAAIRREIEDQTVLTVISKPVARAVFVLGKFAGVAAAVMLFFHITSVAFLLTIRHHVVSTASTPVDWPVIVFGCAAVVLALAVAGAGNFWFGWTFMPAAVASLTILLTAALGLLGFVGRKWQAVPLSYSFGPDNIRPALLAALGLTCQAVLLMTAVAVAASTRLSQLMNLLLCVAVLGVCSAHPWLTTRLAESFGVRETAIGAQILGALLPDLTKFYALDVLTGEGGIPADILGWTTAYFLCYAAAILAAAVSLFQTRALAAAESSSSLGGVVSLLSGLGRIAAVLLAVGSGLLAARGNLRTLHGVLLPAGLFAAAAGAWVLFSAFGRARRWAWWVVTALTAAILARGAAALAWPELTEPIRQGAPRSQILLSMALSGLVLLAVLSPKTRRHFRSKTD